MKAPTAAVVFAMPLRGHFNRLQPLIAGLVDAGVSTYVFTDASFREHVTLAGAQFVDLFEGRPVDNVDSTTVPWSARYVSFAGRHGDAIVEEVRPLRPGLVVHDSFAVIGVVVANHLGVPRVNVCAGHNLVPARTIEAVQRDVPVQIADACWSAVHTLRERHGMPDATPFSYASGWSRDLNVYCEPPEFLGTEDRKVFEPVVFFGSLWPSHAQSAVASGFWGAAAPSTLRIYASFGTVVWRYYEREALEALHAIADAVSQMSGTRALISFGGAGPMEHASGLAGTNVRVEPYVDQWNVLREASVHITHQGLNSTHEAIFHGVPMISYPFFWDQPVLAKRCEELGLSVPLVGAPRTRIDASHVRTALNRVASDREGMIARLGEARRWELETIRARKSVIERIVSLTP